MVLLRLEFSGKFERTRGATGMKRLTIVVPYRGRESHLKTFVPTLRAYFARDKLDREIPYRVLIVEQDNELPFNRGALKNIGYLLGRNDGDYTCFHDIDYLPVWADYSWSDSPAVIIWYGAESRPIALGRSNKIVRNNLEFGLGGVVLMPNEMFARVNGFANCYWGWGYEDSDLKRRFEALGIATTLRRGTYLPLDHDNEGFNLDGSKSPIALVNARLFENRWLEKNQAIQEDGFQSVRYEIVSRTNIPEGSVVERPACWEKVTVRLRMTPRQEQLDAIENSPVLPDQQPFFWKTVVSS
jgi:N-terminal region of glycosyl transferase group 7/N-terminal domain of galactosyltransferase